MTTAQGGGKVVSHTHRLPLLPGNAPVLILGNVSAYFIMNKHNYVGITVVKT